MSIKAQLEKALGGPVEERVDLAGRTSVRVGGAAELFAVPESQDALARAIDTCRQAATPLVILGAGSNTIAADAGVHGLVLKLSPKLVAEDIETRGALLSVKLSAGQPLNRLVAIAKEKNLIGMEFLVGIPGTIGGAVIMNAGTKAGSTERVCAEIGLCDGGAVRTLRAQEIGFGYRGTALPAGSVVTWARFELKTGSADELAASRRAMDEDLAYRKRTQPLNLPNSGSVFRNPPGDHAARLIQACGLKGLRQGDAQISELHANFIVNRGQAKAREVLALMRRVQESVLEKFGVLLVPEVKLMGEFDPADMPRGIAVPEKPAA